MLQPMLGFWFCERDFPLVYVSENLLGDLWTDLSDTHLLEKRKIIFDVPIVGDAGRSRS